MRVSDLVAGNCARTIYRITSTNRAVAAKREWAGLKRVATYPTEKNDKQQALVAASQRLLLAHPPALDRGSAYGAPSAKAMRYGSAIADTKKIRRSAAAPTTSAIQVRRNFDEGVCSLVMLPNVLSDDR